jgi:hypothetical protein
VDSSDVISDGNKGWVNIETICRDGARVGVTIEASCQTVFWTSGVYGSTDMHFIYTILFAPFYCSGEAEDRDLKVTEKRRFTAPPQFCLIISVLKRRIVSHYQWSTLRLCLTTAVLQIETMAG